MQELINEQKAVHLHTGQTVAARIRRNQIEKLITRRNHTKWLINGEVTYIRKNIKLAGKLKNLLYRIYN